MPYERLPASFAVRRGTRLSATTAGLAGKTIAVERFCGNWEASTEKYLRQKFGGGFRIKTYDAINYCNGQARSGDYQPTLPRRLADLEAGAVDAVFDSKLILYPAVAGGSGSGALEFAGPDQFGVEAPAGIAVRKGETALLAALNAAIAAIMADGTYHSIERKYFPFPVYGE